MQFIELCKLRSSIRSFSNKTIEDSKLEYIKECTRLAPSACNLQPWKFIIVSSKEKLLFIHKCYNREWFTTAPLCFIVCKDNSIAWTRDSDKKQHGDIDTAIATEHICLSAAEQGLGSCIVCNFDVPLLNKLFDIQASFEPVALIPIGYPVKNNNIEKKRKDIDDIFEQI